MSKRKLIRKSIKWVLASPLVLFWMALWGLVWLLYALDDDATPRFWPPHWKTVLVCRHCGSEYWETGVASRHCFPTPF